ncbi:hypothetical protein [Salipiger mangrovisoli]|uniref:Uncharacterized protein n=1 Tax=Salipiger mangrovisoli TaxID=2865933 RepID=A0ABR9WZR0_9RHOB|nr:hypothetical protein [Salipiger mangrovisoli]MBE9636793.1 hypothetical protein [Salipiger mangrovisoli]
MNHNNNEPVKGRRISSGGGFVIACLSGLIGIVAGIVLWNAGAHPLVVLLAYLMIPAAMILALFLLSARRAKSGPARSDKEQIAMRPGHGSGQL